MLVVKRLPNTEDIAAAVKANDGYCICAVEKNPDTKCMCKDFLEQKQNGVCHCGLYEKTITED